jgi:hypothetical protein
MKVHHQPPKILGFRVKGYILEYERNKWFTFDIRPKNRDKREELNKLRPRVQKLENKQDNYFKPVLGNTAVYLLYLNQESANGLYKDPENNLPYEILDMNNIPIYRQSIIEGKEDIFNNLERIAVEEGLRR